MYTLTFSYCPYEGLPLDLEASPDFNLNQMKKQHHYTTQHNTTQIQVSLLGPAKCPPNSQMCQMN